ncbi:DNA repair protein RAD51 homolog 4 [Geodia barretti]|uniref:DNA repair protein RAD51 homolog 4 n=1 Tax=Geodia barretti TaxID=519541 RepID=A0AA35X9A0_GEOBA|nr:DNA repair protein RAD51 homolog 4 [Geodia barretti]
MERSWGHHCPSSDCLDTLLGGGVMTGELTELTGVPASGKTQLCHSLAVAGVLHSNSTVLWVDSTGGFSATRLHSVLTNTPPSGQASERMLERIKVHRLFNLFDLMNLLEATSKQVSNQTDWFHANLHLVLIDSVTPLLSPLLGGHGGQGHALLSCLAALLRSIAHEHSIAVVYTNNTVSDMTKSEGVKPSLGQTWACVPHTRVSLSPPSHSAASWPHHPQPPSSPQVVESGERVAKLTKSSRLAVDVCTSCVITDRASFQTHPTRPNFTVVYKI